MNESNPFPRTHQCLSTLTLGSISDDRPDIVLETLIQHPISFIQHKVCYTAKSEFE